MKSHFFFITLLLIIPNLGIAKHTNVKPKKKNESIILLHGLARDANSMWFFKKKFEKAGYTVHTVDYKSINKNMSQVINDVTKQIDSLVQLDSGKIHFVGYSLGGLQTRSYLDRHKVENLGNVVLIGTPNNGTPFVDHFKESWWLKILGQATLELGTDSIGFPKTLPKPYYPIGIIAGKTNLIHNEKIIPGPDDGIVPIESTKIEGMTDFIVIETNHSTMKINNEVAKQALKFIKAKRFDHKREK